MANNAMSRDLKRLSEVLDDYENDITHPDWVDDLEDYATKLDRLVEAATHELKANEVHVFKDGQHKIEYRSMNQYALAAALEAISPVSDCEIGRK